MVEDNCMHNKLESITRGNSLLFDTINSSDVVLSTSCIILDGVLRLYMVKYTHTRNIGMFLVLLSDFDDSIRSSKSVDRFYDYKYFCFKYHNIFFHHQWYPKNSTKYGQF